MKIRRILVPTDFEETAGVALHYGRELAVQFGAALDVLHVAVDLSSFDIGFGGQISKAARLQAQLDAHVESKMAALITADDRARFRVTTTIAHSATPANTIAEYAHTHNVDLIVIGSSGKGAFAHMLIGSVADRVLRTSPCPVMIVKHPEHEFLAPDALQRIES